MPNDPQDEADNYEPAVLADNSHLDEAARLKLITEREEAESRREILLGQITVARGALYAAEEAGDAAKVAEITQEIAELTRERNGL